MAKAPTPGRVHKGAPPVFRIRVRDETLDLSSALPIGEKFAVRTATGLPFEAYWSGENRIGEDSVCVLWWLARRANGEPNLSWPDLVASWPTSLGAEDLDFVVVDDDDGDDPGKSEPA